MSFLQEISDEQLHRDHRSQMLGGTDMYTLMGLGYLDKGESYLDAIMAVWERKRGLGTKPNPVNEAMRTGVEQEPAAYQRLMASLAQGRLNASDEGYQNARIFEPFRGLRIQDGNGDGYGRGGNMDAPLFDVSGEYEDPVSGETVSGNVYARRYAEEHAKIQLQKEVNKARELDGEAPWDISEARYQAPPYAGVADIKVTQSATVFFDEIYSGVDPRFVVQTHHYLEVLREDARKKNPELENDPKLLGIFRFCLENNRTHFHEIDYDADLVQEMKRRADLFTEKCLKQGIPPNSSELRDEFYVYPVKGTAPEAELPDAEMEEKFKHVLDKYDRLKERQKEIKESENHLKKDMGLGVQSFNKIKPGQEGRSMSGVFVDGRIITLEKKMTNRKVTNEAAVSGALLGAGEARNTLDSIQKALHDPSMSAEEKLAAIARASDGMDMDRLPTEGTTLDDFQSTQRFEANEPTIAIKDNKITRTLYQRKIKDRDADPDMESTPPTPAQTEPTAEESTPPTPAQTEPAAEESTPPTPAQTEPVAEESTPPTPAQTEPTAEESTPPTPAQTEPTAEESTPPTPAQTEPAAEESTPPTPAQYRAPAPTSRASRVSAGEPLEDTPLNDSLEVEQPAATVAESEPQSLPEDSSLEGLESRPTTEPKGKAPDLLAGEIPEDLLDQELPDMLFAKTSEQNQTSQEDDPGEAKRDDDIVPGIAASPFM